MWTQKVVLGSQNVHLSIPGGDALVDALTERSLKPGALRAPTGKDTEMTSDQNTQVAPKERTRLWEVALLLLVCIFGFLGAFLVAFILRSEPAPVATTEAPEVPVVVTPAPPAIDPELQSLWIARAAEHSGDGEFSLEHLSAMDTLIDSGTATLLTPQRLRGYHSGGDYPMVDAALKQHLGQFAAYVLEVGGGMYIVPLPERLAACSSV